MLKVVNILNSDVCSKVAFLPEMSARACGSIQR